MSTVETVMRRQVAHDIGRIHYALGVHHYSAAHQHRVLVQQLRRLLLYVHQSARYLHVQLIVFVGFECALADDTFVGAGIDGLDEPYVPYRNSNRPLT